MANGEERIIWIRAALACGILGNCCRNTLAAKYAASLVTMRTPGGHVLYSLQSVEKLAKELQEKR